MNTELQEVIRLGKEYNLIPIVRCLLADTETPIRVFQHVADEKRAFLLESVEGGIKWARYSFIGTDPFLIIRARDGKTHLETQGRTITTEEKPLEALKSQLALFRSPSIEGLPRFTGGAVGFFGYDLLQYYENLPKHRVDDIQMDDIQFMFCDQVIAFDHFKQQMNVIANVHIPDGASEETIVEAYRKTCQKLDATIQKLKKPLPSTMMTHSEVETTTDLSGFRSNLSKEQYVSNVKAAQEYIKAGDIFQVVLSQRFETDTDVSPLQVYRVLRTLNPSPYMYYLKMDDEVIVGTSPEMLVRVEDERVDTRAIAGTRPRGKTPEHDLELEQDLLADQKERAEHLMLVDLVRNDVGRVAEYGTVSCDSFMQIERYSHVMHIVSNVSGTMNKEKDFFDAFLSCLPAGTVSGAPKLRAMEIIAEFENERRGTYAGAIGYLGFSGNMDSAITIRTIVFKNGKAYIQAGAGVVFDSDPVKEYEETVNKARGMMTAIRTAEAMFKRAADNPNLDYYVHVPAL